MKNFSINFSDYLPCVTAKFLDFCLKEYQSDDEIYDLTSDLMDSWFAEPATEDHVELLRQLVEIRHQTTINDLLRAGMELDMLCDIIGVGIQEQICGVSSWLISLYKIANTFCPLYQVNQINVSLSRALSTWRGHLDFLFEDSEEMNPKMNIFKYLVDPDHCNDKQAIRDLAYRLSNSTTIKIIARQLQEMDAAAFDLAMETLFGDIYDCPAEQASHDERDAYRMDVKTAVFKHLFTEYGDIVKTNLDQRSTEDAVRILSLLDRDSAISYLKEKDLETREMLLRLFREQENYDQFRFEKVFPEA